MSTETPPKAKVIVVPKLVTLGNGLKLAESWVNNMSGLAADDESSEELDFEGRPPRLGLGSKVILQSKMGYSTDPVERRLRYKLDAGKKRAAKDIEELTPSETNGGLAEDDDDDDDPAESRSSAFTKKRATFISPSMQAKKKLK